MIEYIKGEIVELTPARMILECNGIGYELHISLTTYSSYQNMSAGLVYLFEVIREDAHLLYGFATRSERELFLLLTSVSGVGPNTARMILSSLPPDELLHIIAAGDESSLTMIKGVGTKTAQRILVDLKGKVKSIEPTASSRHESHDDSKATQAVSALVMLGFQKAPSQKAVEAILKKEPTLTVEQLIKTALKML